MMRLINLAVIAALIAAATFVYRIKYEATRHAEEIQRLRLAIQRERDAIGDIRAEWAKLNRPDRLQALAERHLSLKPLTIDQMHALSNLPEKPNLDPDPIGRMLEALGVDDGVAPRATGSVPTPQPRPAQPRPAGGPR